MKHTVIGLGIALWAGLHLAPAAAQQTPQAPAQTTSRPAQTTLQTNAPGAAATPAKADPLLAGAAVYDKACFACHASGVNNAPRVGDRARWATLVKEGPAKVAAHGWLGERAMPPRGGVPDLSLPDFAAAVAVMAQRSQVKWPAVDAVHLKAVEREVQKESDKRARRTAGATKPAAR